MIRASKIYIVFFCMFISCTAQTSDQQIDDVNRIRTFFKIVSFFQKNEIDSAKQYIINKGVNSDGSYEFAITSAIDLISKSDKNFIVQDSIGLVDSSDVSGEMVYIYKMNFYNNGGKYIGRIEMPFVNGNVKMPLTLYVKKVIEPIQLKIDD